jgi:hypothetical protein
MFQETAFFIEGKKVYLIDAPTIIEEDEKYMLAIVESFNLVQAYEDSLGGRSKNTFYVWYKEAQETFKGEITISNLVGWSGQYTFIGFGDTLESCLENMIWQFATNNTVYFLED